MYFESLFKKTSGVTTTAFPPLKPADVQVLLWIWIIITLPPAVWFYARLVMRVFREVWARYRGNDSLTTPFTNESRYHSFGKQPESLRYGSEPFDAGWPPSQLILWVKTENGMERNACAWRLGDFLVTASHCLPSEDGRLCLSTPTSPIQVCDFKIKYNHDELAIVEIPVSVFTTLQVKSAKVCSTDDAMVRITGCGALRSTTAGILTPTDILGMYKYSGTTKEGYSGAPYMVGDNTVAAMHMFGGDAGNLCMSAKYIQMVVQQLVMPAKLRNKLRVYGPVLATSDDKLIGASFPESLLRNVGDRYSKINIRDKGLSPESRKKKRKQQVADDWYEEDVQPGQVIRARRSRFDPDSYEFQLGGHYYTVDDDGFQRLRRIANKRGGKVELGSVVGATPNGESLYNYDDVCFDEDEDSFLERSSETGFDISEKPIQSVEMSVLMEQILTLRKDFLILTESISSKSTARQSSTHSGKTTQQNSEVSQSIQK
ncbi:hypothetical protein 1 [Hubei sobemo-like virus 38]|uniref:hypothetical protein 1 n=1 Tax=Hubei sobemo-like virus 38 TaxID=1923225 RepID=UPI000909DA0A|nr:hypothetical protein 1 [Hubei sobemo-like virus 38]APG75792.1 hypothetical protein 1 [Hubei sobemo-like virus 38]